MKKISAVLSLLLICTTVHASGFDPFAGPKPIAVLIDTNPWLMAIGSDTPSVVIYDDGGVIYEKKTENDHDSVLLHTRLSPEGLAAVKSKLGTFGDYSKLKHYYNLSDWTDQPETKIYLSLDGKEFVTGVYGLKTALRDGTAADGPKVIIDLYAYLTGLDFAGATPWQPAYVEAMVWSYDYAPEESIHWPKDWPGLSSPYTFKRGDAYSIFLPGTQLPKLIEFLSTEKEKGAVEIDGKKWSVSVRYTYPGEPVWRKAFRRLYEKKQPGKSTDQE